MTIGDSVHWFLTSRCNLDCLYCFKPAGVREKQQRMKVADALISGGVKKVTIGGGEPTLVREFDRIVHFLKSGDLDIALHTNGTKLNKARVDRFEHIIDDIALPVDTLDDKVQKRLRGDNFSVNKVLELAKHMRKRDIRVGFHTVFTSLNYERLHEVYEKIKELSFDYWRIYEFNENLSFNRMLKKPNFHELRNELNFGGTPKKGHTDCLYAKFLIMEKEFGSDKRVQFVGVRDCREDPYFFVDCEGNASYYTWFSGRERRSLGNVLKDSFPFIKMKLQQIDKMSWELDDQAQDEFINAEQDRPLWARLWDGGYIPEEVEAVDEKYIPLLNELAKIYVKRAYGKDI